MRDLLQTALRWVVRRFVWFVLIAAILAAGNALRKEFAEFEAVIEEITLLRSGGKEIDEHLRRIEAAAADRVQALATASLDKLKSRVESIEREIRQEISRSDQHGAAAGLLTASIGKVLVDRLKRDLAIAILEQERDHLLRLLLYADSLRDSLAAQAKLEELRLAHVDAYAGLGQIERQLAEVEQEGFWKGRLAFWSDKFATRRRLGDALAAQKARNQDAYQRFERQRKVMESISVPGLPRFEIRQDRIDLLLQPLRQLLREREARYQGNWVRKATGPVIEVLPAAALILLSLVLIPVATKGVFYFLVAPLAARLPPICLLPQAAGTLAGQSGSPGQTKCSAVSLPLAIGPGQELLIHPEYLQSASVRGKTDTKWLLDWSYPFSSLASGLFALTRVRCDAGESFVISATRDPLSEVGIVSLPEGSALVLQPRALVGVVQRQDRPVRISRHWRLGSLHAWLTLQLRYLIFHGPAELIVTGCRGIRVEPAGTGRSINQAATLGFSANVDYATRRCETFGAYLMGKDELFNDYFTGESGFYIYEEMPNRGRTSGIAGRGIEGIADSVLKVFGI